MWPFSARTLTKAFLYLLLIGMTLVTFLFLIFSQLDLNTYRASLEKRLSSALEQPVTIEHCALTFHRGITLEMNQLQIGPEAQPFITVPRIYLSLEILPLFRKQFIFNQALIEDPVIQLSYPRPPGQLSRKASHQALTNLGINALSVQNATVRIYQRHQNQMQERFTINQLYAVLENWRQGQQGHLVVRGKLPKQGASIQLDASVPTSANPEVWRQAEHSLTFEIRRFSTGTLPKLEGQSYPDKLDLTLQLAGTLAEGSLFKAHINDSKTDEPLVDVGAMWTSSEELESLSSVQANILGIPLQGNAYLSRLTDKTHLTGKLGISDLTLNHQLLKKWRIPQAEKLLEGTLEELSIVVEKSLAANETAAGHHVEASLLLSGLEWDISELKQFQDLSLQLELKDDQLNLRDGVLVIGGQPVDFSGRIFNPFFRPSIDLNISSDPSIEDVSALFQEPQSWSFLGHTPCKLRVHGPLSEVRFNFQADLTEAAASHKVLLNKPLHEKANLTVSGTVTPSRFDVEKMDLRLGAADISANGFFDNQNDDVHLFLATSPVELKAWQTISPLARRIQLAGKAQLEVEQKNNNLQGRLTLNNAGAHLTHVIADLKKVNGTVLIDRFGLNFHKLDTQLGESRLTVTGLMSGWSDPKLSLDVLADEVRAQDLIFPNTDLRLYDLTGHLRIDKHGIEFAPVNVRLEQETLATVEGGVFNFSDPQVKLDIHATHANILDVITAFQGPATQSRSHSGRKLKPIIIHASAEQGTLGGLKFKNATGTIKDHQGLFTLSPLRFENGDGWCNARVQFSRHDATAPLKVSGHAEKFDASVLHHDFFKRPGLVSGDLAGDFYIEGDPRGGRFWNTAEGGIHIDVRDGTLRKFHSLAKIFSLLNVSQIFAGKLPDMNKDGMPFNKMEGSLKIGQGEFRTDDLAVTSEAMNLSVVGSQNLSDDRLDFTMGVMPLRTVDKIITNIPLAGWVLTGENKAFLTAYFKIQGSPGEPEVSAVPVGSVSKTVYGIFRRTLGLPGKLVKDVGSLLGGKPEKKKE